MCVVVVVVVSSTCFRHVMSHVRSIHLQYSFNFEKGRTSFNVLLSTNVNKFFTVSTPEAGVRVFSLFEMT